MSIVLFASTLVLSLASNAESRATALPIRIHDYTGLPTAVIQTAQREAARIFDSAGIPTVWPTRGDEAPVVPGTVVVNVLLPEQARHWLTEATGCGFALAGSSLAGVFVRCLDLAWNHTDDVRGKLLGYLIAHEVGHLLIGPGVHSPRGLMKGHWSSKDLEEMQRGQLLFQPGDVHHMQRALRSRRR